MFFYFILKVLFVLEIFKLLSWLLVMQKIGLKRKPRLISKFLTSQTGQQIIEMHVLSNISRSKGNQTMKFGQVLEYNKANIFLENS